MNLTNGFFDPRRRIVPPIGWEKFNKSYSFMKLKDDIKLIVSWDGMEKRWILTASTAKAGIFFKRRFEYSYDCFEYAETIT